MSNFYAKVSILLLFLKGISELSSQNEQSYLVHGFCLVHTTWYGLLADKHFAVLKIVQNLGFLCCDDYLYRSEVARVNGTYSVCERVFSLSS